jgi:biotin carboxylase
MAYILPAMREMDSNILCLASYEKGADFLRECGRRQCRVILVTVEKLKDADWPRDAIHEIFWLPGFEDRENVINAVSWLARTRRITRIVPLDEFDLELAASLREHLRLPGMGETAVRYFRDKLAMRGKAASSGVRVPRFTSLFHDDDVRAFTARVPPPWVLKPRTEAASIGIRKLGEEAALWAQLEALGDRRSRFLLEQYVAGSVYHVDAIVADSRVVFAQASRYATPPFDVAHGGGLFCSATVEHNSAEEQALLAANAAVVRATGIARGALHTEFIRADADEGFVFLETAARVGGAHIVDLVQAATGVNLWREWAAVEIAAARREPYIPPEPRRDYAGIVLSLARQEWPDTAAYDDAEIVFRVQRRHHAGLVVASPDRARVLALLEAYMPRFREDFFASMPAPDKATA